MDYYVKIYGDVEPTSLLGEKNSLEIPYSSLMIKDNNTKGDPLKVNIEVFALDESTIRGKGGPFPRSMSSINLFLFICQPGGL